MQDNMEKQRIIQELVPGKQITLAHIIANPDEILYKKLGLDPAVEYSKSAIGILTLLPAMVSDGPTVGAARRMLELLFAVYALASVLLLLGIVLFLKNGRTWL